MDINYLAILACGIVSMALGFVWYGPLFGKKWMEIIGATEADAQARKDMQKKATPLYVISFILSLFQAYILSLFVNVWTNNSGISIALWAWAAFILPTVAAGAMWNNDSSKISWSRFWIQSIYYLVLFIIFGLIIGSWK